MTTHLSIGKLRSFQLCTSYAGTFTCLALDHRQNLIKANSAFSVPEELSQFKLNLVRQLAGYATSVLLDPEYSAAQAIANNALPGNKGLVVALESTGYSGNRLNRRTRIIPGWNVEKVKRMGASMAKLLVYYNPDSPIATQQEALVVRIAEQCQKFDLGFMLEILTYPIQGLNFVGDEKKLAIVGSIKRLGKIPGVDLVKVEFPFGREQQDQTMLQDACLEISNSIKIPWIVLSAAVSYEQFIQQAKLACRSGASGVAVGRAVWQETISMNEAERQLFLESEAMERLIKLQQICNTLGKPWTDFYAGSADTNWCQTY